IGVETCADASRGHIGRAAAASAHRKRRRLGGHGPVFMEVPPRLGSHEPIRPLRCPQKRGRNSRLGAALRRSCKDPHACGLIEFGRCAAPKSGGAIHALGRPCGVHVRTPTLAASLNSAAALPPKAGAQFTPWGGPAAFMSASASTTGKKFANEQGYTPLVPAQERWLAAAGVAIIVAVPI